MREENVRRLSFVLGVALLTGCATTDRLVLDTTPRPPTTQVEVFTTGEKPQRGYKEIARLSFMGPREDEFKALRHFLAEARSLGANGLLLDPIVHAGVRTVRGDNLMTEFVFKASAVAYIDFVPEPGSTKPPRQASPRAHRP
jgi:hypothetical protein